MSAESDAIAALETALEACFATQAGDLASIDTSLDTLKTDFNALKVNLIATNNYFETTKNLFTSIDTAIGGIAADLTAGGDTAGYLNGIKSGVEALATSTTQSDALGAKLDTIISSMQNLEVTMSDIREVLRRMV